MIRSQDLFNVELVDDELKALLNPENPWDILAEIDRFLENLEDNREGDIHETAVVKGKVFLAKGASIKPHAYIEGPAWIGPNASVGHAAYVRGGSILASGAKVGHASEVKHSLLLAGAQAPHFNYVGDSILGNNVNIGAGVKLANFHTMGKNIKVDGQDTGLRKFSAALGDNVSIGCNSVLSPGTIMGQNAIAYSGAMLLGVYPANSIIKNRPKLEIVERT